MFLNGLSIIIPTYNRNTVFYKTLRAAYNAIEGITSEIIVINDSKNNTVVIDDRYKDKVKLINNSTSGVASARNLGAKNAAYSNLLFLDDDIIISPENIAELNKIIDLYPGAAINFNWKYPSDLTESIQKNQFGRYLHENKFTSLKGWSNNLKWNDTEIFEVDLIASYFLCMTKTNFELINGYNETFPHAGAEDFDFAMRLKKSGIKGICHPLSIVWHNEEDRVDLLPWLQRKERAAETRKIAAGLGYKEMVIHSSRLKAAFINFLYHFRFTLFLGLKLIPNKKQFDPLYFKMINNLLAMYLYHGYFKVK